VGVTRHKGGQLIGARRFSSPSQKWMIFGFGVLLALISSSRALRSGVAMSSGHRIGSIAFAAVAVVCMSWVAFRPVLIADASGVRVHNLISTRHLSWSEISGFRIGPHKLLSAVCLIDLKNGSSIYAFAVQVPNIARGRAETRESRMVAELNALLALPERSASPLAAPSA
jgi:hypothetical protein